MSTLIRNIVKPWRWSGAAMMVSVAVGLSPNQARADNAEVAAAVLLGAAAIYVAHDSEPRHAHRHHASCGHHVAKHRKYQQGYHSGYRNGYYDGDRHDGYARHGKHHRKPDYWRHSGTRDGYRAGKHHWRNDTRDLHNGHRGRGAHRKSNDWNTRVIIREY